MYQELLSGIGGLIVFVFALVWLFSVCKRQYLLNHNEFPYDKGFTTIAWVGSAAIAGAVLLALYIVYRFQPSSPETLMMTAVLPLLAGLTINALFKATNHFTG